MIQMESESPSSTSSFFSVNPNEKLIQSSDIYPAKGLKNKELFYTNSPPSNLGNEANYL